VGGGGKGLSERKSIYYIYLAYQVKQNRIYEHELIGLVLILVINKNREEGSEKRKRMRAW